MTSPETGAVAAAPLDSIPDEVVSLADYERLAHGHLPGPSWRHIQAGTGAETTLRENAAAFERIRIVPRVLRNLRDGNAAVDLLGERHSAPFLLAPIAYHRLAHPDGELATVRGAVAMGVGMTISTLSSVSLEEIAETARDFAAQLGREVPPLWFQLYFQADRASTIPLVRRAEEAGYTALVFTVDASMKLSNFALPAGVDAVNLRGMPDQRHSSRPGDANVLFGTPLIDAAPNWEDLAWLRSQTKLPIILKGVLSPDDAVLALEHGANAVVVSNHGGRVLDGMPSPLAVLPAIADRIDRRIPVFMDSGIRRGTDVLKAIALGADAVMVGRPQIHALAVAGALGVAHALYLLRAETELAMAQAGCSSVADIARTMLLAQ